MGWGCRRVLASVRRDKGTDMIVCLKIDESSQGEEREGVRAEKGEEHDPQRQGQGQKVDGQVRARHQRLQELFFCGVIDVLLVVVDW